jgi:hypothetical protein
MRHTSILPADRASPHVIDRIAAGAENWGVGPPRIDGPRCKKGVFPVKQRIHPQDFIALVAGAYALLSPIWTTTTDKATTTMIVLGAITVALAVVELVRPDMLSIEGLMAVMGAAFIVAPWIMGFSDTRPMAWTAWLVGLVTLAVGALDLQVTRTHRGAMATPH